MNSFKDVDREHSSDQMRNIFPENLTDKHTNALGLREIVYPFDIGTCYEDFG